MTNTYLTGNPLGSSAAKDLFDNASNLDDAVNSGADSWTDRFSLSRFTWAGIERQAASVIAGLGYIFIGDYDANGPLNITLPNQVFTKDGEYWKSAPTLALPYTTVNNWVTDQPKFRSVGDAVLRSNLANAVSLTQGAAIVGRGIQVVSTIAQLKLLSKLSPAAQALTLGYYAAGDDGGSFYRLDAADVTSVDNGGSIIVAADGGRWKLIDTRSVSIRQFGAKGDNVTDDSVAVQATITYALTRPQPLQVTASAGQYVVSNLQIPGQVHILGTGVRDSGTIFRTTANAPVFHITAGCRLENFAVKGSGEVAKTLQALLFVDTATATFNSPCFHKLHLQNGFDNIKISGVNPCFYIDLCDTVFTDCVGTFLYVNNTSSAGVDLIMNDVRMVGGAGTNAINFNQGLGSVICNNLQLSITGAAPSVSLINFGIPAAGFGGAQFSNSVLEGSRTAILGTAPSPWKEMHFTNCLITGQTDVAAQIAYVTGAFFTNCTFSSLNATRIIEFAAGVITKQVAMAECSWQGTGGAPAMKSAGNTNIELSVTNPSWAGSAAFIDFVNVPSTQLQLTVVGGTVGVGATPIILLDFVNTPKFIQTQGVNFGPQQFLQLEGTLSGAGAATVAHGITSGQLKICSVSAWYKGGSGQMIALVVGQIDGINIPLTGGTASAKYRVQIVYNSMPSLVW